MIPLMLYRIQISRILETLLLALWMTLMSLGMQIFPKKPAHSLAWRKAVLLSFL